jgi:hypothetical protein
MTAVEQHDLEGVVAKRKRDPYRGGVSAGGRSKTARIRRRWGACELSSTAPTPIPSNRSSPSSRHCCAKPPSEPSRHLNRNLPLPFLATGVRQLFQERRLRFNLIGSDF